MNGLNVDQDGQRLPATTSAAAVVADDDNDDSENESCGRPKRNIYLMYQHTTKQTCYQIVVIIFFFFHGNHMITIMLVQRTHFKPQLQKFTFSETEFRMEFFFDNYNFRQTPNEI